MSNHFLVTLCCAIVFIAGGVRSVPLMMNMPQISKMEVQCAKSGMSVEVEFDLPFDGIIFSKGHFSDPACRFVHKGSGSSTFVFMVPGDGCGTESVAGKLNFSFHNVLVIQIEDSHQEAWENSRQIQCLFKSDTQSVAFQPPLSVVDGKNEEIRTQVVIGTGIDGPPVNQDTRIKIGDPVTLLFYISQDYADMFVKNCFASDGLTNRVQLTDTNGWTLRPKLMKNFRRTNKVVHASMTAFRIADSAKLSLSCEVELCLEMCNNPSTYTAEFYPFITTKQPATVTSLPPTDPPIHSILPPYRPTVDP